MNSQYSSEKDGECLAHCPGCRGVVMKQMADPEHPGSISIRIRCPHCEDCIQINIVNDKLVSIETVHSSKPKPT